MKVFPKARRVETKDAGQRRLTQYSVIFLTLGVLFPAAGADAVIVNDITQLNPIPVSQVVMPLSVEEVSRIVAAHAGCVCIGGGRYSQGGQTATDNCLFLDMRAMDKIVRFDAGKRQVTVEAGITWRKLQETLDRADLSVRIMQSYSNFTVGGSLSVNVHGRYVGEGPLIRSVKSIRMVLADGSVKNASRTENPDLFYGAIGGYGGLGVIVEATLDLTRNVAVRRVSQVMDISDYKAYFFRHVRGAPDAVFHNADIYPPYFTKVNAVTWYATQEPVTVPERLAPRDGLSLTQQGMLWWISEGPFGKQLREYLYDPFVYTGQRVEWRNYEASYDVISLEPLSRKTSTYVLQEYFIPVAHFDGFVPKIAQILRQHNVNVLNISIRHALPDPGSLLAWARGEVFSFVIYYRQGVTETDKAEVKRWTGELIDAALSEGGSYYLPYQIIATQQQFQRAYPRAQEYFALKKRVDPTCKFRNRLWDRYYAQAKEVKS